MNQNHTDTKLLPQGTLLNNECFRIIKKLGEGGFGITYLAEELAEEVRIYGDEYEIRPHREPFLVVIKELFYQDFCTRDGATKCITISRPDRKAEFDKMVDKQVEEGRTLRRLNHKNIVTNRKIFKDNDTAYIVMEYLEGEDLEELLKKSGKLSLEKTLKYTHNILEALMHSHLHKVLHLDVKPSNIFIRKDDEAILIDFGASLTYNDDGSIKSTTSKLISGKSYYAPVEQEDIDNLKSFDGTLDTYSLAGTFYHLLTGNLPPRASLLISGRETLIPPSDIDAGINDYYDAVVQKGLSIHYNSRFISPAEFKAALDNEKAYTEYIRRASDDILNGNYGDALKKLHSAAALVLPTKRTTELTQKCNEANNENLRQEQYAKHYQNGLRLEAEKDYESALKYYTKALAVIPDTPECITRIKSCEDKLAQAVQEKNIKQLTADATEKIRMRNFDEANALIGKLTKIEGTNDITATLIEALRKERKEEQFEQFLEQYHKAEAKDDADTDTYWRRLEDLLKNAFYSFSEYNNRLIRLKESFQKRKEQYTAQQKERQHYEEYPSLMDNVELLVTKGHQQLARQELQAFLQKYPQSRHHWQIHEKIKNLDKTEVVKDSAQNKKEERYLKAADDAYNKEDYAEAAKIYIQYRSHLDGVQAFNLGYMYDMGIGGVTQSYPKAKEWYEKAIAKGNAVAMNNLGVMYFNGDGITKDYFKAKEWYEKAIAAGNDNAMNNLGNMYYNGEGVDQSYSKAKEWYEKAIAKGDAYAMYNLGNMYAFGYGMQKDTDEAIRYYRMSCEAGYNEACIKAENLEKLKTPPIQPDNNTQNVPENKKPRNTSKTISNKSDWSVGIGAIMLVMWVFKCATKKDIPHIPLKTNVTAQVSQHRLNNPDYAADSSYTTYIYTGQLVNGIPEDEQGEAVFYDADDSAIFKIKGEYKNGLPNGEGIIEYTEYRQNQWKMKYPESVQIRHEGTLKNRLPHGKGKVLLKNTKDNSIYCIEAEFDKNHFIEGTSKSIPCTEIIYIK